MGGRLAELQADGAVQARLQLLSHRQRALSSHRPCDEIRAVDPDSSNPDPAFQVNPDTVPDPIRIQGFGDQKLKKIKLNNFF
jgi:hypothetical protein